MGRWKNWRRHNPLALCLVLVFALVVSPATSVFAYPNYDITLTGSAGYTTSGTPTNWEPVFSDVGPVSGSTVPFGTFVLESYATLRIGSTFSNMPSSLNGSGYLQSLLTFMLTVNPGFSTSSSSIQLYQIKADIVDVTSNYLVQDFQFSSTDWANSQNQNQTSINLLVSNKLPTGNVSSYQVLYAKVKLTAVVAAQSIAYSFANYHPTLSYTAVDSAFRIRSTVLYDSIQGQIYDKVNELAGGIISDDAAAQALDQANQNFVQDAAQLESHQAVLENAADASVGAVDMNQINLIDTYSGSVSFWSQLIGQLPTVLGSLWYVFIFGLLLAFVLFVLRIRR